MAQKEFAQAKANVIVKRMGKSTVEAILEAIPTKTYSVLGHQVKTKNKVKELHVEILYGPVWGCRQHDVLNHMNSALNKAGSKAVFEIVSFDREVIKTRDAA
jgi:uncharacterized protein (DUF849 family)